MNILKSRALWTALIDALVGVAFLLLRLYWPVHVEIALEIWKYFQPVVAILIVAFTVDDAVRAWAGVRERELRTRGEG